METKRLLTMVYEIFKTLNNLNSVFMKDYFITYQMLLIKGGIYTSIIKIQQSLEIRVSELLAERYGTHCLNKVNGLLHCQNLKKSLKRCQDQNVNPAYANKNELPFKYDTRYAQHFVKVNSEPFQVSEVELFAKTVNDLKPLKTVIAKRSTLGI